MMEPPGAILEVSLERRAGEFSLAAQFAAAPGITVLFGQSGSGKSMTLRCISGLTRPDAGRITIAGVPVFDSAQGVNLPPHRRGIGVVLQQNALFPHLSVQGNIEFGLVGASRAGSCS